MEQTTVTFHVKDLPHSKGISVRPDGLTLIPFEGGRSLTWDVTVVFIGHLVSCRLGVPSQLALWQLGPKQVRKLEIVQYVMSGRSTRGLFADKAAQTASVDLRTGRQRCGTRKSSRRRRPVRATLPRR